MKWKALLGVLIVFAGFAGPAAAQSVRDGYGGRADVLGEVGTVEADGGQPAGASPTDQPAAAAAQQQPQPVAGDALPFTGADVFLLLLGGVTLVGAGVALRRLLPRYTV